MNKCLNCENDFLAKRDNTKFCSDICRATFNQNIKNGVILIKIYALINPKDSMPFYIGKTVGSLTQRLNAHIKDREGNIKKRGIIKELKNENILPSIKLLEEISCENEDQEINALMREKYWMDFYSNLPLCNTHGITQEFKPRMLSQYKKSASQFNYFKKGGKSKPMGARFEEGDLEFIYKRTGLNTPQQVVDFLLHEYCKLYRVEKQSVFQSEPLKEYDSPRLPKYVQDEPKKWQEPQTLPTYDNYLNQINGCTTLDEIKTVMVKVKNDTELLWLQKNNLEKAAKFISKDFYND